MEKIFVITTEDSINLDNSISLYRDKEKAVKEFNKIVNHDIEEYKPANYERTEDSYWDWIGYYVMLFEQPIL